MASSVYKQFAENLFALATARGSIAEVCRQTGINRQQFNKYLAGVSLPSEKTLEKIAGFFGVRDLDMFLPRAAAPGATGVWAETISAASAACEFEPGLYAMYAPWLTGQRQIMRATAVVRRQGGLTRFARFIHYQGDAKRDGVSNYGRLDGLALQNNSEVTFFGRERRHWDHFFAATTINLKNRVGHGAWPGIASTFLPTGLPAALPLIVERQPDGMTLRESLGLNGLMKMGDPGLPADMEAVMGNSPVLYCPDTTRNWRV
jgi:transcriptional regulator with XRE-family HTH domain